MRHARRFAGDSPSTVNFSELLSVPVKVLSCLPVLLGLAFAGPLASASDDRKGIAFFERNIRPLLSKHCYQCHSSEATKLKGNLYLDSRAGMQDGGDRGRSGR